MFLKRLLHIVLIIIPLASFAQLKPNLTQFMFNPLVYNPAYAGAQDDWVASAQTRIQWVGANELNAPKTYVMSGHGLLGNEINGVGFSVVSDDSYYIKQNGLSGSFSHRLIFKKSSLSFGMSASVFETKTVFDDLLLKNREDIAFNNGESSSLIQPNFGVGLFHYSRKHYLGISSPELLDQFIGEGESKSKRVMYFNAGYVLELGKTTKIKPNAQVKYTPGAPIQIDLNANILLFDVLWFGFSYRSLESLDLLLEIHFSKNMRLGYSYDLGLNDLNSYNNGTHEFMLSYKFVKTSDLQEKKSYTPRYF